MRVLYTEDDENDAFFMERAFAKLSPADKLTLVSDGKEVMEYLSGEGKYSDRAAYPLPDIVCLDIKMPVVTGLKTLEWIRQQEKFSRVPVVMFTSSGEQGDVDASNRLGANAYLVKPSDPTMLVERAQAILTAVREWSAFSKRSRFLPVWGNLLEN